MPREDQYAAAGGALIDTGATVLTGGGGAVYVAGKMGKKLTSLIGGIAKQLRKIEVGLDFKNLRIIPKKADEPFTTFYHGTTANVASDIRIKGIDLSKGSEYSDFGQGFYLTTSREEALLSAGRGLDPNTPLDVVSFRVPDSDLSKLSSLRFKSTDADWQDFVRFHKTYGPRDLLHGGQTYDLIEGPLFRRYSGADKAPIPWLDRTNQTSIHTQNSVDLFNYYMLRSE
jgi:hypothetical protein